MKDNPSPSEPTPTAKAAAEEWPKPKGKKLLYDDLRAAPAGKHVYIRAWREGRPAVFVVEIWEGEKPVGKPDHVWEMPGVIGLEPAIEQSILQSV